MKIGIIIYHKNLNNFINENIIEECLNSIRNQTFDIFDIIELDYGNNIESKSIITNFKQKKIFYKKPFNNHINAMNYLLNKCFNELEYDIIFNINLDDIYDIHRFEYQLRKIIMDDYVLVGSNYKIFKNNKFGDINKDIKLTLDFESETDEQSYLKLKINKKKCIIPLSSVCFTKESWDIIKKIDKLPTLEMLLICKKIFSHNKKIHICKDFLLNYRIHDNQSYNKYKK